MKPLTASDRELAQALDGTGLPYRAALVLIALGRTKTGTLRQLELVTKLRKQELKAAIKDLEERKWVKITSRRREDSTAYQVYGAREPFKKTLTRIIAFEEERIGRIAMNLELLREQVE